MDDAGTHKICRIRVDFLKKCRTKPNNLYRRNVRGGTLVMAKGEDRASSFKSPTQCPDLGMP